MPSVGNETGSGKMRLLLGKSFPARRARVPGPGSAVVRARSWPPASHRGRALSAPAAGGHSNWSSSAGTAGATVTAVDCYAASASGEPWLTAATAAEARTRDNGLQVGTPRQSGSGSAMADPR